MARGTQKVHERWRGGSPVISSDNWACIPAGDRWREGRTQAGLFKQRQPSEIKQGVGRPCARDGPYYSRMLLSCINKQQQLLYPLKSPPPKASLSYGDPKRMKVEFGSSTIKL